MDLISFTSAGREYAVDINQIREVIRLRQPTPVPDVANFVEGVINLRGKVISLINLRRKLGLEERALKKPTTSYAFPFLTQA